MHSALNQWGNAFFLWENVLSSRPQLVILGLESSPKCFFYPHACTVSFWDKSLSDPFACSSQPHHTWTEHHSIIKPTSPANIKRNHQLMMVHSECAKFPNILKKTSYYWMEHLKNLYNLIYFPELHAAGTPFTWTVVKHQGRLWTLAHRIPLVFWPVFFGLWSLIVLMLVITIYRS